MSAGVCLTPELTLLTTAQDSLAEARAGVLFVSALLTMITWILKTIASLYLCMHICTKPGNCLAVLRGDDFVSFSFSPHHAGKYEASGLHD